MGNFDDIVEKENRRKSEDSDSSAEFKGEPINIVALLEGENSPFAEYLQNLNPEMKSKVIIPLAGLLDKYGLGESLSSSPAATGAVGLMSVIGDIAPVLKGLAEFVSGQKNSLDAEDRKFLQDIMEADASGEFSDLFTDVGESVEDEPTRQKIVHPLIGELPEVDISQPIDWMDIVDPDGTYVEKTEKKSMGLDAWEELVPSVSSTPPIPKITMPSLEELAQQAGVSMETLKEEDSNIKPDSVASVETVEESTGDNLVDSIIDNESVEEIYYLDDEEYEELASQGMELESIDEEE